MTVDVGGGKQGHFDAATEAFSQNLRLHLLARRISGFSLFFPPFIFLFCFPSERCLFIAREVLF